MNGAKDQALEAIDDAVARLNDPAALQGLNRAFLVAALTHAREQVMAIQELKYARRKAPRA